MKSDFLNKKFIPKNKSKLYKLNSKEKTIYRVLRTFFYKNLAEYKLPNVWLTGVNLSLNYEHVKIFYVQPDSQDMLNLEELKQLTGWAKTTLMTYAKLRRTPEVVLYHDKSLP